MNLKASSLLTMVRCYTDCWRKKIINSLTQLRTALERHVHGYTNHMNGHNQLLNWI